MIAFDVAGSGSYDDFVAAYTVKDAHEVMGDGRTILTEALTHPGPPERFKIVSLLLDDGADAAFVVEPEHYGSLHVLFGGGRLDPDVDAPLVERLIAQGADVNLRSNSWRPFTTSCSRNLTSTCTVTTSTVGPCWTMLSRCPRSDQNCMRALLSMTQPTPHREPAS